MAKCKLINVSEEAYEVVNKKFKEMTGFDCDVCKDYINQCMKQFVD